MYFLFNVGEHVLHNFYKIRTKYFTI